MDYLAGGRFRATLHRVVNKSGSGRYSIPFFYEPNMEANLEPLISDSDPRKQVKVKKTSSLEPLLTRKTYGISPKLKIARTLTLGSRLKLENTCSNNCF